MVIAETGNSKSNEGTWVVLQPHIAGLGSRLVEVVRETWKEELATAGITVIPDEKVQRLLALVGLRKATSAEMADLVGGIDAAHGLLLEIDAERKGKGIRVRVHRYDAEGGKLGAVEVQTTRLGLLRVVREQLRLAVSGKIRVAAAAAAPAPAATPASTTAPVEVFESGPPPAPVAAPIQKRKLGLGFKLVNAQMALDLGMTDAVGAFVIRVKRGSPAAEAGLRLDDVILSFAGKRIRSAGRLPSVLRGLVASEVHAVKIWRDGKVMELQVYLGSAPAAAVGLPPKGEPAPTEVFESGPPPESGEVFESGPPPALGEVFESGPPPGALSVPAPVAPAPPPLEKRMFGVGFKVVSVRMALDLGMTDAVGAFVLRVKPGSPAAEAGLRPDDVILSFGGKKIRSAARLPSVLKELSAARKHVVEIWRQGGPMELGVYLGAPAATPAAVEPPVPPPIVEPAPSGGVPPVVPAEAAPVDPTVPVEGQPVDPTVPVEGQPVDPTVPVEGQPVDPTVPVEPPPVEEEVWPYQTIYLKDGSAIEGTIIEYAKLTILVKLVPAEDVGGLKIEFDFGGVIPPFTAEEDQVVIPLGHVLSIDWGPTPNDHRPKVEAVLAGLATTESTFYDADLNIAPMSITRTPGSGGADGTTEFELTIGPSGTMRIERESYGLYADGRLDLAYTDTGIEGSDATTAVTIGGAGSGVLGQSGDGGVGEILAMSGSSSDFAKQGAKYYIPSIGGGNLFVYGEHKINVTRTGGTPADPATGAPAVDAETAWENRLTLGGGLGRLINITGQERFKMADRYLAETGLIRPGGIPGLVAKRLEVVYASRVLPRDLVRKTFTILEEEKPSLLVRAPTPEEVIGLLEILGDAFTEREQGLELKFGFDVELHTKIEDADNQYGPGLALAYEKPIDEMSQLSLVVFYVADKLDVLTNFFLFGYVELQRRVSQALTLKLSDTLLVAKQKDDEIDLDVTLFFNSISGEIVYSVLDRIDLVARFTVSSTKFSTGSSTDEDAQHGIEATIRLSYDLY